eukprot:TRINITY_DN939_c0_g3_i1.p1 TRINITY_DN939_c0_g3~~TRINITY_DN939_c0_g3_i1.p1  ORF type:complete len:280 (-),score=62.23 TRINITY_DN939_c0_g3_i1:38-877(-)
MSLPGTCCVSGNVHSGEPKGTETTPPHNIPVYIANPSQSEPVQNAAILIITDVFGWKTPNVRLTADCFAEQTGITTYVPDFFLNDSVSTDTMPSFEGEGFIEKAKDTFKMLAMLSSMAPWMYRQRYAVIMPRIDAVVGHLKSSGIDKLAVVGYCFGGWYTVELGKREGTVQAAIQVHPSMLKISDVENLKVPSQWHTAQDDPFFTPAFRKQCEEVLKKKGFLYEFFDYAGRKHGFAMRGNLNDEKVKTDIDTYRRETSRFIKQILLSTDSGSDVKIVSE